MFDFPESFVDFMNHMYSVKEINGVCVKSTRVSYGALPDIKLEMVDGSYLSAKEMWNNSHPDRLVVV